MPKKGTEKQKEFFFIQAPRGGNMPVADKIERMYPQLYNTNYKFFSSLKGLND